MMGNKSEVTIGNVENSEINVKVTQILSKSLEYNELLDQLKTQQKLFARTPENEQQERLEISAKINELTNRIESFKEDVLRLAEQFQRIEINTDRLKRAKEFFDKGEFGEARAVLECELEQMQDEQRALLIKREEYEQNTLPKLQANAEEFLILALSTQTHYDNPNWLADTCYYYESSIKSYSNKDNVISYAYFLWKHNKLNEAETYYQKYLKDFALDIQIGVRAGVLNNLAVLHWNQNKYEEALEEYEEAIKIFRDLMENDSNTFYLPYIATGLNNLANLKLYKKKYKEALKDFEEALKIVRELEERHPNEYLHDIARTLNNLANFYSDQNRCEEAIENYEEALKIYAELIKMDSDEYLSNFAVIQINISKLYQEIVKQPQKSIDYAVNAIKILLPLAEKIRLTRKYQDYLEISVTILKNWDLSNEEIKQLIAEKTNENVENQT